MRWPKTTPRSLSVTEPTSIGTITKRINKMLGALDLEYPIDSREPAYVTREVKARAASIDAELDIEELHIEFISGGIVKRAFERWRPANAEGERADAMIARLHKTVVPSWLGTTAVWLGDALKVYAHSDAPAGKPGFSGPHLARVIGYEDCVPQLRVEVGATTRLSGWLASMDLDPTTIDIEGHPRRGRVVSITDLGNLKLWAEFMVAKTPVRVPGFGGARR